MIDAFTFLLPAMAICLVIASLHVYLGMHILEREVIFVDLALAQLATLGALLMVDGDAHEESLMHELGAFAFTLLGAAIFATSGRLRHRISQEAIVGVVYAVSSAAMILVLSQSPHGGEELKDALVGALLITTWEDVVTIAIVYAVIGALHFALRSRFLPLSWTKGDHGELPPYSAWWDFAFYALFGVVITLSVQAAGVLLVFSFLIVPAMVSKLFAQRLRSRLLLGWLLATLTSLLGLAASWTLDLPTGATIVVAFGALLLLTLPAGLVLRRE